MERATRFFGARLLVYLFLVTLLVSCGGGGESKKDTGLNQIPDTKEPQVLQLVWEDNFDQNSPPNLGKWRYETGYGNNGWGNDEWQLYTDSEDNVHVENGNLVITADCPSGACGKRNGSITSARITTKDKFSIKYGKIQARIKPPSGQQTWSAFWMLGANFDTVGWPKSGEIDIMEMHYRYSDINSTQFAMHWYDDNAAENASDFASRSFDAPLTSGFHIFEMEWDEKRVIGRIDGINYFMKPIDPETMSEFMNDFFLILNIAIGGTLGNAPDAQSVWPQEMLVDWVRVYSTPPEVPGSCESGQISFDAGSYYANSPAATVSVTDLCAAKSSVTLYVDNGAETIPVDMWLNPTGNGKATVNFGETDDTTDMIAINQGDTLTVTYTDSQGTEQTAEATILAPGVTGCMDADADNYNPDAVLDDGSCFYHVDFAVNMNCSDVTINNKVFVTGPFCGWSDGCPLSDADGDGIWTGTYAFEPGTVEYKYMVDSWTDQENLIDDMQGGATCAPFTDFSNYANRLVTIVDSPVALNDNYGSCDDCPVVKGCPDKDAANYSPAANTDNGSCMYNVTFAVDMGCSGLNTDEGVRVTGLFCGWSPNCTLSDADEDGVWTGVYQFGSGDFEYKYIIGSWADQENLIDDMQGGGTCAPVTDYWNYANRVLSVDDAPVSLADTYGTCSTCSSKNNVVFSVDMNCYEGSTGAGVRVTGPFCGWSPDCVLSDADGDGVWTGTYQFDSGDFEYKYIIGNWAYQEDLIDDAQEGGLCVGNTDYWSFANRVVSADSPVTLLSDTFDTCDSCAPNPPPGITGCMDPAADNYNPDAEIDDGSCEYSVTFNVDTNCSEVTFNDTVAITGPFCNFCGKEAFPLSDNDGDGVWTATFVFPAGDLEYKYMVGTFSPDEYLVDDMQGGAQCAPVTDYNSYANRLIDISGPVTLDDTFGSCTACP
jgi:beta-glucanase (GH16 family)